MHSFHRFSPTARILALIAVALAPVATYAATSVNASANISWVAPVNDVNGVPLAVSPNAVTSYKVYAGTQPLLAVPTTPPLATITAPSTATTGTVTANIGDTLYVYVVACNAIGCSGLSAPGTNLVQAPAANPGVPTGVTLTVVITMPRVAERQ